MFAYNKRKHDDTQRCIDTRTPKKARYNEHENTQPASPTLTFEIGVSYTQRLYKKKPNNLLRDI
jgi:hypothetical protein